MKCFLSEKLKSNEKITLVEDNLLTSEDNGNAELLNSFFSSAVKNLKILVFSDTNPQAENIFHLFSKRYLKIPYPSKYYCH